MFKSASTMNLMYLWMNKPSSIECADDVVHYGVML